MDTTKAFVFLLSFIIIVGATEAILYFPSHSVSVIYVAYGFVAFGANLKNTAMQFLDVASMQAPLTGQLNIYERARQAKIGVEQCMKPILMAIFLIGLGDITIAYLRRNPTTLKSLPPNPVYGHARRGQGT